MDFEFQLKTKTKKNENVKARSNLARTLFLASVPDHLRTDPDILKLASKYETEMERCISLTREVKEKEEQIRVARTGKIKPKQLKNHYSFPLVP